MGLDAETTPGRRGEYTVWVNGQQVAQKDSSGFPSEQDVLAAVKSAVG
jgi:hypothetical protein